MKEVLRTYQKKFEIASPTTAKDLLGVNFKEPEGLSLLNARIFVFQREGEDGSTQYAAMIDYPLEGRSLLNLLVAISPSAPPNPSTRSVVQEWVLYDKHNSIDMNTARRHEILGEPMNVFLRHRKPFLSALSADKTDIRRLIESSGNFLVKNRAVRQFKGSGYDIDTTDIENDHAKCRIQVSNMDGKLLAVDAFAMVDKEGKLSLRVLSDTFSSFVSMKPAILWTKNKTGERQLNLKLGETQDQNNQYGFNGLVGCSSLVYFYPDIKKDWPKEQGLRSGGEKLPMGPSQIPVVILQRLHQILQLPFFEKAEQHVAISI